MGLIFDNKTDQKDIDHKKAVAENQANAVNTDAGNVKSNVADNFSDGKLEINASGAYYTPASSAIPDTSTVEGRMAGLLAKESPYLQSAKSDAAKASNRRGLLNSTMAATAGEKAAIDAALPIAQQDASYDQNIGLQENQGKINEGLYKTQGDISSKLSKQEYEQNAELQKASADLEKLKLETTTQLEYEKMTSGNKEIFNNTLNAISEDYMNDYLSILTDKTLSKPADRQAALTALKNNTQQRYENAAAIAGVELAWTLQEWN